MKKLVLSVVISLMVFGVSFGGTVGAVSIGGTPSLAIGGTEYAKPDLNCVTVIKPSGLKLGFKATANTDKARWAALKAALVTDTNNCSVLIGPGDFDAGTDVTHFGPNAVFTGCGGNTRILNYVPNNHSTYIGGNSTVQDIWFDSPLADGNYTLGISNIDINLPIYIRRCNITGDSDGIYPAYAGEIYLYDCDISTHYDAYNMVRSNTKLLAWRTSFRAIYNANGMASHSQRAINSGSTFATVGMVIELWDCNVFAYSDDVSVVRVRGITMGTNSNTSVIAHNCNIQAYSPKAGTALDIENKSAQINSATLYNCTGSRPNGDLNWAGANIHMIPYPTTPIPVTTTAAAYWYQSGAVFSNSTAIGATEFTLPQAGTKAWAVTMIDANDTEGVDTAVKPYNGDHIVIWADNGFTVLDVDEGCLSANGGYAEAVFYHNASEPNVVRMNRPVGQWTRELP